MRYYSPVLTLVLCSMVAGCAPGPAAKLEDNKGLIQRFTEATNAAQWDVLRDVVAPNFVRHSQATAGPEVRSLDEFVTLQQTFLASMPDQHVTIDQLVAEGDLVAVRARYSGTLTGPMGDFPATGKSAETTFLAIFRIADHMIAEMWVEWDNVAMLTQLGLFPPPGAPED